VTRSEGDRRDPIRVDTDAAFEAAYTELAQRIDRLAPVVPKAAERN
jgi:hypothetical protein